MIAALNLFFSCNEITNSTKNRPLHLKASLLSRYQ